MSSPILYDVVRHGRVVYFCMASTAKEAINKWLYISRTMGPKFFEGLYGYNMPGVGMHSIVAVPAFGD